MEFKEPEAKKSTEEEEKSDKPALRRARTVSFLRPLSDVSTRSDSTTNETVESRRSSSISSRRASRPPSLSYSRTSSTASISLDMIEPPTGVTPSRPSLLTQWESLESKHASTAPLKRLSRSYESPADSIAEELPPTSTREHCTQSLQTTAPPIHDFVLPEGYMLVPITHTSISTCTCTCHSPNLTKPTYTSTSTSTGPQTSPPPSPSPRMPNLEPPAYWPSSGHAAPHIDSTPVYDETDNPFFMGRMMSYFSKPGYQLGDSLARGYGEQVERDVVYEFINEEMR